MQQRSALGDFVSRVLAILTAVLVLWLVWLAMQPSAHDLRMQDLRARIKAGDERLDELRARRAIMDREAGGEAR